MACADPYSFFNADQGQIEHIDFELTFDFVAQKISGRARYKLSVAASGQLDLDTRSLTVFSAMDSEGKVIKFQLSETDSFLGEKLSLDLPVGTQEFELTFETSPDANALQWLEPEKTAGGKLPFLYSQCQMINARTIFPCQDSPAVRFTYTAALRVPAELTPVMAAAPGLISPEEADGTVVHQFEMPQPIPSYLFALTVGNLEAKDLGPRSRVFAEPKTLEAAAHEFAEVESMLTSAEQILGPYLWERFDFVIMPPAFPFGGMENPRMTFLTPALLAGDRSLTNVLAHELAHSWTGNLVTNATMDDLWLNEGFTVWAERRILEQIGGTETFVMAAAIGRAGLDETIEKMGADSPYTKLKTDLSGVNPDDAISVIPYEKGFLFVSLLEQLLGREQMDVFIQQYINRFKFVSITTAQFEAFVEEVHPGLLLRAKASEWLHEAGVPDNAPVFKSAKLTELKSLASTWAAGKRPSLEEVAQWSPAEKLVYLQALPKELEVEQCAELEALFDFKAGANSEIICCWLMIAATSVYEPAFDQIQHFLHSTGRMKYVVPLFNILMKNDQTASLAREIIAEHAENYHPIVRGALERVWDNRNEEI